MAAIEFDPDESGGYKKVITRNKIKRTRGNSNTSVLNKKLGPSTNINNDLSMFNEVTGRCVSGIRYTKLKPHYSDSLKAVVGAGSKWLVAL